MPLTYFERQKYVSTYGNQQENGQSSKSDTFYIEPSKHARVNNSSVQTLFKSTSNGTLVSSRLVNNWRGSQAASSTSTRNTAEEIKSAFKQQVQNAVRNADVDGSMITESVSDLMIHVRLITLTMTFLEQDF